MLGVQVEGFANAVGPSRHWAPAAAHLRLRSTIHFLMSVANVYLTQGLHRSLQRHPHKIALTHVGEGFVRQHSFAQLRDGIARHAAAVPLQARARATGQRLSDLIEAHLATMAPETATLTRDRHVQPDFHGNRSPLADPWRKGAISGLTLETGLDDLARDYLATVQALAYGTRHIIEVMRGEGAQIDTLVLSGGLARNKLFQRENADATGCRLLVPDQEEPVLLGAAMLAAVASGQVASLADAMGTMSGAAGSIAPRGGEIARMLDNFYFNVSTVQFFGVF